MSTMKITINMPPTDALQDFISRIQLADEVTIPGDLGRQIAREAQSLIDAIKECECSHET